jgi:(1->4)-alpha-D-glucan 1-alpha-D-glucosylmutase
MQIQSGEGTSARPLASRERHDEPEQDQTTEPPSQPGQARVPGALPSSPRGPLEVEARRLLDLVAAAVAGQRLPLATYRLQLHKGFTFEHARGAVPYLADLGVTDVYSSPILRAAPGSSHGYDVVDHTLLNPELGTQAEFDALSAALRERSLGLVLDIVPNHMGIGSLNPLWWDLLENGPSARSARFFDVEFHPLKEELANKVLVPMLGDPFGAVLERGEIQLVFENGAFEVAYFAHRFPVNPRTYPQILGFHLDELEARLKAANGSEPDARAREDLDELKSILSALEHLPQRHEREPERQEERGREKEVVKRRLAQLFERSSSLRAFIEENVRSFNGVKGEPRSFDPMDRLLSAQAYRLAWWRVSSEEINYRRFFDINSLAAIRVEDPVVFEEVHRLPLQLVGEGKVTALRIDHPDGLQLPSRYFRLLQEARTLQLARAGFERERRQHDGAERPSWDELEPAVRAELAREIDARGASSPLFRPLYLVAEKILGRTEQLPLSWAVRGTTGYDFLNALNGIFVARENEEALTRTYFRFIRGEIDFDDLVYAKKKLILYTALAAEMNLLARQLNRISEHNRWTRDFTLYALRAALIEIVACFPVYRTYVDEHGQVDERDRRYIELAVAKARRRNPVENAAIYDFIKRILLQRFEEHVAEEERQPQLTFALKLQQMLGPVMAKGVEDTAFYGYNRLVSLNEVGGEPRIFGTPVETFHDQNLARARSFPRSMLATATHDTKRGEDVRARIDALSELPREWKSALFAFARRTAPLRRDVEGHRAPDENELMIFWQTLLGAWPLPAPGEGPLALPSPEVMTQLRERMQAYLFKAIKEAKVNTSWIEDNAPWEQAVTGFVGDVLSLPPRHRLWSAFLPFARRVAQIGLHNSLSQLVLKLASPGVPDFYQGNELWDLSLVDPDNRRPVDFGLRARQLGELRARLSQEDPGAQALLARELLGSWEDGRIKLLLTHLGLVARREHGALFGDGAYLPLSPEGARAETLCAFARAHEGQRAVAVVPRLAAGLIDDDPRSGRLAPDRFAGTVVPVPGLRPGDKLRDVLTGEERVLHQHGQGAALAVDELFSTLPVALLVFG